MVSKEFNSLMYSIALTDWDNALKITYELKKQADPILLPVLGDMKDAITARKKEDYKTAKRFWKKIQIEGKNLNDKIVDFAKACYYDTIADSNKTKTKKKKYHLKVRECYEKLGDSILILLVDSWLSEKRDERAKLLKMAAEELKIANDTKNAHLATAKYYKTLADIAEKPKEKAELYKKASKEHESAGDSKRFHRATAMYFKLLAEAAEKPEEKAELYKKASEELTKAGDTKRAHLFTAIYYGSLAETIEKPEEKAGLHKKAANEFTKAGDTKNYHRANAWYYSILAEAAEKPKEQSDFFKKASEELTKAGDIEEAHKANAAYYTALVETTEKPEIEAEFLKKAAEEFSKAGDRKGAYLANASHYISLATAAKKPEKIVEFSKKAAKIFKILATEFAKTRDVKYAHNSAAFYYKLMALVSKKPKERAKLFKKVAMELMKAGDIEEAHRANALHYTVLVETTEKPEEKAKLLEKAAEELKDAGDRENARRLLAKHYFFRSLGAKGEAESERYQLLASGETKLGWLYIAQIAFNEYKKSKTMDTFLLEQIIKFYKKYLQSKNKKFPVFSIYLCGDVRNLTKQITINMSDYFIFNVTSFPRGEFKNSPQFKEEVKKNDFVLMVLRDDIDGELLYELGLITGIGKPMIVLILEKIKPIRGFLTKVATITSNKELAFKALKLFSFIKSGESLEIEDKKEKSIIDGLLKGFKDKPLIIPEFEPSKAKLSGSFREGL